MAVGLENQLEEEQSEDLWRRLGKREGSRESGGATPRPMVSVYFRQMRQRKILTLREEQDLGRNSPRADNN
jgi:hypothetical protein